ncbi:RagB/SusD family nutrient uptake outer membrane protein [Limibacter armeniacum]|uniref:RagB/SusD family nutrient uptake outer membrane protein n=1 Tax=Limibacter armeniacum TaxID=466084 RepID=UPI002FE61D89
MRKLFIFFALLPMIGCSGFLEEVDQDKLVPKETDHFAALLLEEFSTHYPIFSSIDHMTDNLTEDPSASTLRKFGMKTTYTWQREIEIDEDGNSTSSMNNTWEYTYEDIAIANYVIELVDDAMGEPAENEFVKGEAYFIRAISYFNLLNLYGQPYNAASAKADLGVPLRTDIGVEETYNRNSVAECYAQIEADIAMAKELIEGSNVKKTIWHPSVVACDLLMSRVKLYQQQWDAAIEYANKVTEKTGLSKLSAATPFITESSQEVLYSYNTYSPLHGLYDNLGGFIENAYRASTELIELYDDDDIRKAAFFAGLDDGTGKVYYRTRKYGTLFTTLGYTNMRVAEAYLNRAEAYAQLGNVSGAINDITALHAMRYTNTSGVVYPTDAAEVLSFVLTERRKELCYEDHHRWFDLRRMSNRPTIEHTFTLVQEGVKLGTETYTLLPDDFNYTLPIPIKERNNNPLIRNNERYEKIPVIENEIILN